MRVLQRPAAYLVVLALLLGATACGSGSVPYVPPADADGYEPDDDDVTPPEEPPALDGAVLWVEMACGGCHAADGSGGFGPDLTCYPADGLLAYLLPAQTPHVAGAEEAMIPEEALALATFLGGEGCTGNVPASHTLPMGSGGILHRPGHDTPETACTPCHGPQLEGEGTVPSCASCHEAGGTGCSSCHTNAQDDGDGIPTSGRRAVMGEFALTSHHGPANPTDDDCRTCHEMTKHKEGEVRLYDVDDTSTVIVLTDDPASDETEALKLEAFCLACHDSDAANGSAPFSDGVTPPAIDATAWAASGHVGGDVTCAGDGTSYGCHSTKHGSAYAAILYDTYVVKDPNVRTDGDYDACWGCHSKQTILFSDDAFDEYHKKHVIDEDAACAVCHGVHGSYDATERGLISFERAVDEGWATFSGATTLSSAFQTSSTGGNCSLRCHNKSHSSKSYQISGN